MIQVLTYKVAMLAIRVLPFSWSRALAELIFKTGYWVSPLRRKNIEENLAVVVGSAASRITAKKLFPLFGRYLVEFLSPIDKREVLRKSAKQRGVENMLAAYHKGRGVIVLTSHLGNWEMAAYATARLGVKISAVFLTHANSAVNDIFMKQRRVEGLTVIPWKEDVTRKCIEVLKRRELLAIAGDIDFPGTGIEVELFGRKTRIARGPIVLAKRMGAPIVPGGYVWPHRNEGLLFFDELIEPDGQTEEDLAKKVVAALEKMIGSFPTQWFCFEKMWEYEPL